MKKEIFKAAKEKLGISYMASHWKKSRRQIYSWAADPNCCEVSYVNPLEKIKIMMLDLKKKGGENIVIFALHLIANPLGYEVIPLKVSSKKSSKNLFKNIIINISELMKMIAIYYDETKDKTKNKSLLAVINQIKFQLTEIQINLKNEL